MGPNTSNCPARNADRLAAVPNIFSLQKAIGSCIACGANGDEWQFDVPGDPTIDRSYYRYGQCESCGTTSLRDKSSLATKYYDRGYYSFHLPKTVGLRDRLKRIRDWVSTFGLGPLSGVIDRFSTNPRLIALRPLFDGSLGRRFDIGSAFLDIGCGEGLLLREMQKLGFANLTGVDPYMQSPFSRGALTLMRGTLDDIRGKYDVVMLHHSLEHITDAAEVMTDLHRVTELGGIVIVRIPLIGSWAWRNFGGEWAQMDAPRHIHLFTSEGFRVLANRSEWEISRTIFDSGIFQFTGSISRLRGENFHSEQSVLRNFTRTDTREFSRRATRLNLAGDGDQAAFYLKASTKIA